MREGSELGIRSVRSCKMRVCLLPVVRGVIASVCDVFFFQAEDGIRDVAVTGVQTCALPISLPPATNSQVPSGRDVVKPEVYLSMEPAARGGSFQIAVVMNIRPGFHVNAREKSEEYLIATDLKAQPPPGFTSGEVV